MTAPAGERKRRGEEDGGKKDKTGLLHLGLWVNGGQQWSAQRVELNLFVLFGAVSTLHLSPWWRDGCSTAQGEAGGFLSRLGANSQHDKKGER